MYVKTNLFKLCVPVSLIQLARTMHKYARTRVRTLDTTQKKNLFKIFEIYLKN